MMNTPPAHISEKNSFELVHVETQRLLMRLECPTLLKPNQYGTSEREAIRENLSHLTTEDLTYLGELLIQWHTISIEKSIWAEIGAFLFPGKTRDESVRFEEHSQSFPLPEAAYYLVHDIWSMIDTRGEARQDKRVEIVQKILQ